MDIKIEQTFTLTPDDLKMVVADFLKRERGVDVAPADIRFHVENVTTGYGLGEHTSPVLMKTTAVARPKIPNAETREAMEESRARLAQWEDPAFPTYKK